MDDDDNTSPDSSEIVDHVGVVDGKVETAGQKRHHNGGCKTHHYH